MMVEHFGEKAPQHVKTLKANLSRYQQEPKEAYDTEKAMEDLHFFSRIVVSDMRNEKDLY